MAQQQKKQQKPIKSRKVEDLTASHVRRLQDPKMDAMIEKAYGQYLDAAAKAHPNVPRDLIKRIMKVESNGNPKAGSPAGAVGLMQLMPDTAVRFGVKVSERTDPQKSIMAGTQYLSWLIKRYGGDLVAATAAYNAGEGNVDKGRAKKFRETRAYTAAIHGTDFKDHESPVTQLAALPQAMERAAKAAGIQPPAEVAQAPAARDPKVEAVLPPRPGVAALPTPKVDPKAALNQPLYFTPKSQAVTAEAEEAAAERAADRRQDALAYGDTWDAAVRSTHIAPFAMAKFREMTAGADPYYNAPSPEQIASDLTAAGIPLDYMPRMEEATSEQQYRSIISNISSEFEAHRTLADSGALRAAGVGVAAAFADPVTFALNLTPVGWTKNAALAGEISLQALRARQVASGVAMGAAVGAATEVPQIAMSETQDIKDGILGILISSTMGGVASDMLGSEARRALRKQEFEAMRLKRILAQSKERGIEIDPASIINRDIILRPNTDLKGPTREEVAPEAVRRVQGEVLPPEPRLPPAQRPALERPVIEGQLASNVATPPRLPEPTRTVEGEVLPPEPRLGPPQRPALEGPVVASQDGPGAPGMPPALPAPTRLLDAPGEAPGRPGGEPTVSPGVAPVGAPDAVVQPLAPGALPEPTPLQADEVLPTERVEPTMQAAPGAMPEAPDGRVEPKLADAPVTPEPALTKDAEDLLAAAERGTPAFVSKRMRRIAEENGIDPKGKTPDEIIAELRAKQPQTPEPTQAASPTPEQPERIEPTIGASAGKSPEDIANESLQAARAYRERKVGDVIHWMDKEGNERVGTIEKMLDNGNFMVTDEVTEKPARVSADAVDQAAPFGPGSVGAAQADRPSVYNLKEDIPDEWYEQPSAFGGKFARWDVTGWLKNSNNPVFKFFARAGEDGVGINKDGSKALHSVEEAAELLRTRSYTNWLRETNAAFAEFDKGNGIAGRAARREQFMEQTALMYEQHALPDNLGPAMQRAVNATRKYFKDYEKELLSADVAAARGLGKGEKAYVPHVISHTKVRSAISKYGIGEVEETLYQSLYRRAMALADLTGEQVDDAVRLSLRHMAKGWLNGVLKRGTSDDMVGLHGFQLDDRPTLEALLRQGGVHESRIAEMVDSLSKPKNEGQGPQRLKRRLDFDMGYERTAKARTGAEGPLRMVDLFERNLDKLVPMYGRQVAGHIAFAKNMGIKSRHDFEVLKAKARDPNVTDADPAETSRGLRYMDYLYDAVVGNPLEADPGSTFSTWGRRVRDFNFLRLMNQVGFAQAAEVGRVLSQVGLPALMKQMPAFFEVLKMARDGKLANPLLRELEAVTGIGTFRLRNQVFQGFSEDMEMMGGAVDQALHKGKLFTADISGMSLITTVQQRMAAAGMSQRIAEMVMKDEFVDLWHKSDVRELASLGLDVDQAKSIGAEMKKHAKFSEGRRLHELNLAEWDQQVANDFIMGVHRAARRLVQENSYGTSHPFLHSTTGKFLAQFRSFMLNAWTKQTLHGLAMHDIANTVGFLMTSTLGAMSYAIQQTLNEPDPEKLDERLEIGKLMLAGFNRSGYASLIPVGVDTMLGVASGGTVGGLFSHARSSGLGSNLVAGNPTVDLINKGARAVAAIPNAVSREDYEFSQADARAVTGVLPFNNILGIKRGLNVLLQDLPRESSKGTQDAYELMFSE